MNDYCGATGVAAIITDLQGRIVVEARRQRLCEEYYRAHPDTRPECLRTDASTATRARGKDVAIYQCPHGLTHAAAPILIENRHLAYACCGQFLLEPPAPETFRARAREHGFDEAAYLAALAEVPVISGARLREILTFLTGLAEMLGSMGMARLRCRRSEQALREREERFRAISTGARDAIVVVDDARRCCFWSAAAVECFGYSEDEALGRPVHDLVASERYRSAYREAFARFQGSGRGVAVGRTLELTACHRDGREFPAEMTLSTFQVGGRWHASAVIRDISSRKRAERQLQEQEAAYRALFQESPHSIAVSRPSGEYLDVNQRFCQALGMSREELIGKTSGELVLINSQAREAMLATLGRAGRLEGFETQLVLPSGEPRQCRVSASIVEFKGEPAIISIVEDVTERRRAEEALNQRTRQLETVRAIGAEIARELDVATLLDLILQRTIDLVGGTGGSIVLWSEEGQCLIARAHLGDFTHTPHTPVRLGEGMVGRVAATKQGLIVNDYPAWEGARPEVVRRLPVRAGIAEPLVFRDRLIGVLNIGSCDDQKRFTEQDSSILGLLADQAAVAIVNAQLYEETQREVADRRHAEEELRASRDLLEAALGGLDQAVLVVNDDRVIVEWTRSAEALFGYSRAEMLGCITERLYANAGEFERIAKGVATVWGGGAWKGEALMVRSDGSPFPAAIYGGILSAAACPDHVHSLVAVIRDITERKQAEAERQRLEEQFRQAQKMETVGRLAGGIAHDLNNLLTPILGYAELALMKLSPEAGAHPDVFEIREAAARARDLTHQLLAFSRKQAMELKPVNLSELVARFEKILRRTIREDIRLITRLGPALGIVRGDAAQLQQVLLNLVVNANDAMPSGGTLTIVTDEIVCSPAEVAGWADGRPGPYLRLMVQDTGTGLDEQARQHLFEPFFTTKPEGKGTGLGLATCYGIVKQHGGEIRVESTPGRGSLFAVHLPRAEEREAPPAPADRTRPAAGRERILLIDDARTVRLLLESILGTLGYAAIVAATPEEAIRAARSHPEPIQLLITDVIMPGMNGRQLYERLREIRPDLRVLYISGYTDDIIAPHGVLEPGIHFLAKPFTLAALTEKIRDALAGA